MSGAHTPGPWTVNPFCAQVESATLSAEWGGLLPVAQLLWPTDDRTEVETEANARLIAAAPELLKALEPVANVDFLSSEDKFSDDDLVMISVGTVRLARAAIAKARGEA